MRLVRETQRAKEHSKRQLAAWDQVWQRQIDLASPPRAPDDELSESLSEHSHYTSKVAADCKFICSVVA